MLVFGSRGYRFKRGTGNFQCPRCGGDRTYTRKELKRMGHLFWIPLLPLGSLGEYIECGSCGGEYDLAVLSLPTNVEMGQKLGIAMRSAVAAMIRADSATAAEELRMGARLVAGYVPGEYTEADLRRDLVEMDDGQVETHLRHVADILTEDGKVNFVKVCLALAASDGEIRDDEMAVLVRVATGLGIPSAYIPGIVEQAFRDLQSRNT